MELNNQTKNKKLLKLTYIYYRVNIQLFTLSFFDNDERIKIINEVLIHLQSDYEINSYLNKNNLSKFNYDNIENYIKLYIVREYYYRIVELRYSPDVNNVMNNLSMFDGSSYNIEKYGMRTKFYYFNEFIKSDECKFISMDLVSIIPNIDDLLI